MELRSNYSICDPSTLLPFLYFLHSFPSRIFPLPFCKPVNERFFLIKKIKPPPGTSLSGGGGICPHSSDESEAIPFIEDSMSLGIPVNCRISSIRFSINCTASNYVTESIDRDREAANSRIISTVLPRNSKYSATFIYCKRSAPPVDISSIRVSAKV